MGSVFVQSAPFFNQCSSALHITIDEMHVQRGMTVVVVNVCASTFFAKKVNNCGIAANVKRRLPIVILSVHVGLVFEQ